MVTAYNAKWCSCHSAKLLVLTNDITQDSIICFEPAAFHVYKHASTHAPLGGWQTSMATVFTTCCCVDCRYGDWVGSQAPTIINDFLANLGGSAWWNISTTYYNSARTNISSAVRVGASVSTLELMLSPKQATRDAVQHSFLCQDAAGIARSSAVDGCCRLT
jgi:hypothetical protein